MALTQRKPQMELAEEVLKDEELEGELQDWYSKHSSVKALATEEKRLKKIVLIAVEKKELADGVYRCGAFKITIRKTESRSVAFEVVGKRQIRLLGPKDEE